MKTRSNGGAELVFIPSPGAGHLAPTVEIAKILVDRDDRLSITILVMRNPFDNKASATSYTLAVSNDLSSSPSRIKFIDLPRLDEDCDARHIKDLDSDYSQTKFMISFIEAQKLHVREAVCKLVDDQSSSPPPRPRQLAGFALDMFSTCMVDVADGFEIPSYMFFTSNASVLVSTLPAQNQLTTSQSIDDSGAVLVEFPGLSNSVPASLLPRIFLDQAWTREQDRRVRGMKGIVVNTIEDLESPVIQSFSDGKVSFPPVYPVGPLLNLTGENYQLGSGGAGKKAEILTWLDSQPDSSVVFLCFGSMGSFGADQVREIARALEETGHRFLWSLRRPPPKGELPSDYMDPTDVLPEGFQDRTAEIGKVSGWVPQVSVLGHPAVGGFVSHCGWNSTLESIWFGVPMAAWPMYAEQQFNAFQLVVEWGLAVEIKMDYTIENPTVVKAGEIKRGIGCLMEPGSEMRKRMGVMKEKARSSLMDGGSSFSSVGRFIGDVFKNL